VILRQHRATLDESMATAVQIDPTMPALLAAVRAGLGRFGQDVTEDRLSLEPQAKGEFAVCICGLGVYGFTDGPISGT
jgi:hypothetical protein